MNMAGDAAEQVIRMSLSGVELAAKITGTGAKELATMLYAIMKDQKKTKGKARLSAMLRSEKPLKVFAVKDSELQTFCREAKKYGVLYCVLKDRDANDGLSDIMVRAEDAPKINRIFERFKLATVDVGEVRSEIERQRLQKANEAANPNPSASINTDEQKEAFLEHFMGGKEKIQEQGTGNPTEGRAAKSRQSEPISAAREDTARGAIDHRTSVREELKRIRDEQSEKAAATLQNSRHDHKIDHPNIVHREGKGKKKRRKISER